MGRESEKRNQTAAKAAKDVRKRTPAEQLAEIERVAKEHGADLGEEAFNDVLRKVARTKAASG